MAMTVSNFKPSLALTLAHEGGYVNHPRDPGGATNRGVTQKVYDGYRKYMGRTVRSVRFITDFEVAEIYERQYWNVVRGPRLPCGFDYAVFDFGVNSGPSRAIRYMQRLVGVNDDGVVGLITLAAVEAAAREDEEKLIAQYCANRLAFVQSLSTFSTFGRGWTRRIVGAEAGVQANDYGVIDYATAMALRDETYTKIMPTSIGGIGDEQAGKAETPNTEESFVEAPPVKNIGDVKAMLPAINDKLAKQIGR